MISSATRVEFIARCEPSVDIDAWVVSPAGGAQRLDDDTDDVN
jgi:hypothetical protein